MDPSIHISNDGDDDKDDDSDDDEFGNITANHPEDHKKRRKKKTTRLVQPKSGSIPKTFITSIIRFDSDGRITSSRQCDICICQCRSTSHRIIRLLPTTPSYPTEILSGHGITGALYTSENRDPIRVDACIGTNSGTTTPLDDMTWFCSVLGSTEKDSTRVDISVIKSLL
jgi:hypothetical protein